MLLHHLLFNHIVSHSKFLDVAGHLFPNQFKLSLVHASNLTLLVKAGALSQNYCFVLMAYFCLLVVI